VANSLNQLAMTDFSGDQNDMTAYRGGAIYFIIKTFARLFSDFFHQLKKINDIKWWVANFLNQLVIANNLPISIHINLIT